MTLLKATVLPNRCQVHLEECCAAIPARPFGSIGGQHEGLEIYLAPIRHLFGSVRRKDPAALELLGRRSGGARYQGDGDRQRSDRGAFDHGSLLRGATS